MPLDACGVDDEHLGDGQCDDAEREEPRRLRAKHKADRKQNDAEDEPHHRIGVLLGVAGGPDRYRAVKQPPHFEREIEQRERHRGDGGDDTIGQGPRGARNQRERDGEHRRQAVAEQDHVEEHAADRLSVEARAGDHAIRLNTMAHERQRRDRAARRRCARRCRFARECAQARWSAPARH